MENIEHVHRELTAAKKPLAEDKKFGAWRQLPGNGDYARIDIWEKVGQCELDRRLSRLADIYLTSSSTVRKQIRDYFTGRSKELDEMWMYVRRMGVLVQSDHDAHIVRRALAVAAIEGGRQDFRDTIVSLVLLRHGAERAKIQFDPLFREIQSEEFIAPENRSYFENARTHSTSAIAATVREFGPQEWQQNH